MFSEGNLGKQSSETYDSILAQVSFINRRHSSCSLHRVHVAFHHVLPRTPSLFFPLPSQSAAPQCLSVHWVTWVLWAVSPPISSRGGLSGWISGPRESNADMLRQLRSDWEGSTGLSTICISATLIHTEKHPCTNTPASRSSVFANQCV